MIQDKRWMNLSLKLSMLMLITWDDKEEKEKEEEEKGQDGGLYSDKPEVRLVCDLMMAPLWGKIL